MRIASTKRIKQIDKTAIEEKGTSGLLLMEAAASAVANAAQSLCESGKLLIVCGAGNNGGDGFAAARLLAQKGYSVMTVLVGDPEKLTPDAAEMKKRMEHTGILTLLWNKEQLDEDWSGVVDALFGVGLNREIQGNYRQAIEFINSLACPVVSCDIPSGINGDTGEVMGYAVRAQTTVTFSCAKPGLLTGKGPQYAGNLVVADIGIPPELLPCELKPGVYRHFKGNEYRLLGLARHSETLETMVVYQALYGERKIWVRPVLMWSEQVDKNGYSGPRFVWLHE